MNMSKQKNNVHMKCSKKYTRGVEKIIEDSKELSHRVFPFQIGDTFLAYRWRGFFCARFFTLHVVFSFDSRFACKAYKMIPTNQIRT